MPRYYQPSNVEWEEGEEGEEEVGNLNHALGLAPLDSDEEEWEDMGPLLQPEGEGASASGHRVLFGHNDGYHSDDQQQEP